MEEEAREILRRVMGERAPTLNLAEAISARLTSGMRADLELAPREAIREPSDLA